MAKRRLWPRRLRRLAQAAAFVAFLVFIARLPALASSRGGGSGLMRLSPLSGLGASLSGWSMLAAFWPAALLLAAAVLLGRYFCGWLCPMGALLDAGDRVIGLLKARFVAAAATESEGGDRLRWRRLKYYLLVACMLAALLGVSLFGLFDPLSIATRSFVVAVHASLTRGLIALFGALGWSGGVSMVRGWLGARTNSAFQLEGLTLLALLVLLGLGLLRRRFWCRYLCPLGALYALAARWAVTKRSVGEQCVSCGRCTESCPMGCISPDGKVTANDECILCMQCQAACPTDAVRFMRRTAPEQRARAGLTRRGMIAAAISGIAAYPVLRNHRSWLHAKGDPLLRPPLAGRAPEAFLSLCLRCGQCMRACPTQVIQPAGLEAGLESLWTPKLVPRPGYCEYNCDVCGRVCPTGAIPRFTLEQKHATAMGLAFLDATRCIPWRGYQRRSEEDFVADRYNCGVCEEVCPVPGKAIHFRRVEVGGQELRLPYVQEERCVGCGCCEAVCPVQGAAAIRVTAGFRELPAESAAAVVAGAARATEVAMPEAAGGLRLSGKVSTFTGPEELFDYIDGGAEPYLRLNFIRVTTATYRAGEAEVEAEVWEFQTGDDAFGAFAKDRRGESVEIGDEGAALGGSLWCRTGRFMIAIMDKSGTPPEQTRALAEALVKALGQEPTPRPAICRRLPTDGLDPSSVTFMRDEMALFGLYLADRFIPDGTFGISGGAVGAYGAYDLGKGGKQAGLLLVDHGSAEAAEAAVRRFAKLRAEWGDKQVAAKPFLAFEAGTDNYCVFGSRGPLFAAALFMPSVDAGVALVKKALQ